MSFVQGINYCYRVRARNSCATGMWSHETCKNECSTPNKALAPTLVRKNDDEITVRWADCLTGPVGALKPCIDCSYQLEITGPYGAVRTEQVYNRNQYSIANPHSSEDYSFKIKCMSFNCNDGE